MLNNNTGLDFYNKSTTQGNGTLISNWLEEKVLRTETGIGRTHVKKHEPKKRDELYFVDNQKEPPRSTENTNERILGEKYDQKYNSWNSEYGKSINKADLLPKIGKAAKISDAKFLEEIKKELDQKEDVYKQEEIAREFETTNGQFHSKKDLFHNSIGRRVMKDQNMKPIPKAKTKI